MLNDKYSCRDSYSGGYGADYAVNLAVFTNLSAGTSYEIPPTVMDVLSTCVTRKKSSRGFQCTSGHSLSCPPDPLAVLLSRYLLDGQQYMVHSAGKPSQVVEF